MLLSPEEIERRRARQREHAKRYAAKYPERIRESLRRYRARLKEPDGAALKEKQLQYQREYHRKWRAAHAVQWKAYKKQYREAHRDQIRDYIREYQRRTYVPHPRMPSQQSKPNQPMLGEVLNAGLWKDDTWASAARAIPRTLPKHIWEDAVSSLVLAVLEGEVAPADMRKSAARFVTAAWGPLFTSIDAIIPGTDRLRLIDLISNEREHF